MVAIRNTKQISIWYILGTGYEQVQKVPDTCRAVYILLLKTELKKLQ